MIDFDCKSSGFVAMEHKKSTCFLCFCCDSTFILRQDSGRGANIVATRGPNPQKCGKILLIIHKNIVAMPNIANFGLTLRLLYNRYIDSPKVELNKIRYETEKTEEKGGSQTFPGYCQARSLQWHCVGSRAGGDCLCLALL